MYQSIRSIYLLAKKHMFIKNRPVFSPLETIPIAQKYFDVTSAL